MTKFETLDNLNTNFVTLSENEFQQFYNQVAGSCTESSGVGAK